ncbi:MAG: uracil-DNA glycosylase family protein [Pseudomonadota bacterium]
MSKAIRACTQCRDTPDGPPLPHEPRPVLQISPNPVLAICSQAPGMRAHTTGTPFDDPSGVRLRAWMSVSTAEFYDASRIAIVPMGFCFPGYDSKGGDRPPRKECARLWRAQLLASIQAPRILLLIGHHAQRWHLGRSAERTLTATVAAWRRYATSNRGPRVFVLPHPSWRNNAWIKKHPWFEAELLPELRHAVRSALEQ